MLAELLEQRCKTPGRIDRLGITKEKGINKSFDGRQNPRAVALFEDRREKTGISLKFTGQCRSDEIGGRVGISGLFLEAERSKGFFEQHPGRQRFYRKVKVVSGLTEADIQAIVGRDLGTVGTAATGIKF